MLSKTTMTPNVAPILVSPVPNIVFADPIVHTASKLAQAHKAMTGQALSEIDLPTQTVRICRANRIRNRKTGMLKATTYFDPFKYSSLREPLLPCAASVLTYGKI